MAAHRSVEISVRKLDDAGGGELSAAVVHEPSQRPVVISFVLSHIIVLGMFQPPRSVAIMQGATP